MANTWRATSQGITYAANKDMLDVFNSSASNRYIRVYRMFFLNNGIGVGTGALGTVRVQRITAASAGTGVTPVAHNSANAALNVNTTAGTNRTITTSHIYRQILWQNDEATVTTLDMDALLTLIPFGEIWNSGYGDTAVEPLTAVPGTSEGFSIVNVTLATAIVTADAEIEFTNAAT